MKIEIKNGVIKMTSESKSDYKGLMNFLGKYSEDKEDKPLKKVSAWKGKHKQPCEVCGKKYKNLLSHKVRAHGSIPNNTTIIQQ